MAAARVWDAEAEHFPARVVDIRKFGAQAKHLRRVRPATTDSRSFVEVAKKQMEKRVFQGRDGRDGERFRDAWDPRDNPQRRDGRDAFHREGRQAYQREARDGREGYQREGRGFNQDERGSG